MRSPPALSSSLLPYNTHVVRTPVRSWEAASDVDTRRMTRSRMRSCSWPSNLDVVKPLHSRLARVLCCVCLMMDVNGTIFIRSPAEAHLVLRTSFPHGRVARVSARHTHTDSRHISQMQTDLGCTYIPPPTSSHSHTLSPCMLPLLRLLVRIKSFTCPC